jgi:KUP system potassium uptake protein
VALVVDRSSNLSSVRPVAVRSSRSLPDVGLEESGTHSGHGRIASLTLAALGIVFGDIGTSPLYTLHECTTGEHGVQATHDNILGVLSLIVWSLIVVVGVKYLSFIMKADNRGEGGILALLALVPEKLRGSGGARIGFVPVLVLIGAALLYGDGIITPAISVLSAVEGLEVAAHSLKPAILPITCAILVGLFAIQSSGTRKVGRLFGPVMLVWFVVIGGLGLWQIVQNPAVLAALWPGHALGFFGANGFKGFAVLGGVVLAVTGGEALYADMGHFGPRPIRFAWWGLAMPGLVLNYFGQGALMLRDSSAIASPFYSLVPQGGWTYALVILATLATIIASQALISGAFSLTHQAVQLGYFPRVTVRHTSRMTEGQIYIPQINWLLMIACVVLVLSFKESTKLAAAYGIAVTGTMGITSIVYYVVTRRTWGWPLWRSAALLVLFLSFDIPFFAANLLKLFEGGYVPILVGAAFFLVMITWKRGRTLLGEYIVQRSPDMDSFLQNIDSEIVRCAGTGVFMASNSGRVPPILFHQAQRIKVLHKTVILFTVITEHVPALEHGKRLELVSLGCGFYRVLARCGFMESPNVPVLLEEAIDRLGLGKAATDHVTYYVGRETFLATGNGKMGRWSETIFAFLSRNAQPATMYFGIPPDKVVELGTQIDL